MITVPRWATWRLAERVAVAVPIAIVAWLGYRHRWTAEEGFVYLRVVDQIRSGNGPVFNAGERVEAVVSPLWVALLSVADAVSPARLEHAAAAVSLLATVVGLGAATAGAALLDAARNRVPDGRGTSSNEGTGARAVRVPVGLAAVAALWPTWVWATGGTEVGLTIGWLGTCVLLLARWAQRPASADGWPRADAFTCVVLGLGPLIRPGLVAASVIFVATVALLSATTTRRRVGLVAIAAALPAAYQMFRMGYYGLLVPNASVAREAVLPRPGLGWDYVADTLSPYLLVVPLLTIGLGVYAPLLRRATAAPIDPAARRSVVVTLAVAAAGLVTGVCVAISGGDSLHTRALLPALFAFVAPVAVISLNARRVRAVEAAIVVGLWAMVAGLALRAPGDTTTALARGASGMLTIADIELASDANNPHGGVDGPGLYVAGGAGGLASGEIARLDVELADPDATVVLTDTPGQLGFALGRDVTVVDLRGLADVFTGHQTRDHDLVPGREKYAAAHWLAARLFYEPGELPGAFALDRPFDTPVAPLDEAAQTAWAVAALACAPLIHLDDAAGQPLDAGGFLTNVWRAMSNTTLRYPVDSRQAFRELDCDDIATDVILGRYNATPQAVAEFHAGVVVAGALPVDADPGTLAVAGACDLTLVATGGRETPWEAVDATTTEVVITFDEASGLSDGETARVAALFVLADPRERTSGTVVWLQTDDDGNYRVTQEIPWYPTVEQQWQPIEASGEITIAITADLSRQRWVTRVDGGALTSVPMLSTPGDNDDANDDEEGAIGVIVPSRAAPGTDAPNPAIAHTPAQLPPTCAAVLAHHAPSDATPPPPSGSATPTA